MKKLLVLTLLALAACGGAGDKLTAPPDPTGTYNLQTYNGQAVPAVLFSNAAGTVFIEGGTEVLRPDKSYVESWSTRTIYNAGYGCGCAEATQSAAVESGNYEIVGSQITFTPYGDAAYTGAVANGILTYTSQGLSLRYAR